MTARATTARKGKTITAPEALAGLPMEMFSTVYRACAQLGISPREVDDLEVHEVAAAMGVGMDDDTSPGGSAGAPPPPGSLSRGRRR